MSKPIGRSESIDSSALYALNLQAGQTVKTDTSKDKDKGKVDEPSKGEAKESSDGALISDEAHGEVQGPGRGKGAGQGKVRDSERDFKVPDWMNSGNEEAEKSGDSVPESKTQVRGDAGKENEITRKQAEIDREVFQKQLEVDKETSLKQQEYTRESFKDQDGIFEGNKKVVEKTLEANQKETETVLRSLEKDKERARALEQESARGSEAAGEAAAEGAGKGKGKGKGKGNGGVPPGLAKKGGVPPGLAKKGGLPPGQAKKLEGEQSAEGIAKEQEKKLDQYRDTQTRTVDSFREQQVKAGDALRDKVTSGTTDPKTDPKTDPDLKSPLLADRQAAKDRAASQSTDTKTTAKDPTDSSTSTGTDSYSIADRAKAEAASEANTKEAQVQLAAEKETFFHQKAELRVQLERISLKERSRCTKSELDSAYRKLQDLEAYQQSEDTARMYRKSRPDPPSIGGEVKIDDVKQQFTEVRQVSPEPSTGGDFSFADEVSSSPGKGKGGGVPPGLAKKGGVPPGLAKKGEDGPPGHAKHEDKGHVELSSYDEFADFSDSGGSNAGAGVGGGSSSQMDFLKHESNSNWDDILSQNCQAVMEEIRRGESSGGTDRGIAASPAPAAVKGGLLESTGSPPSNYGNTVPGGALGKLLEDYEKAMKIGGKLSTNTKRLIQITLQAAGSSDRLTTIESMPSGKSLGDFYLR